VENLLLIIIIFTTFKNRDCYYFQHCQSPYMPILHHESKKGATLTMAIALSILDRFAKFVLFAAVKEFCKSIKNWQSYSHG